jgi:hypothetical protein
MTMSQAPVRHHLPAGAVFIDHWHAIVARSAGSCATVTDLTRDLETEPEFLLRVARETADCDRIVVMGPNDERLAFEREYVSLYRRPDRLVDDEALATATRFDLLDRLRVLDS